jgi:hypothetical protein
MFINVTSVAQTLMQGAVAAVGGLCKFRKAG